MNPKDKVAFVMQLEFRVCTKKEINAVLDPYSSVGRGGGAADVLQLGPPVEDHVSSPYSPCLTTVTEIKALS